MSDGYVCDYVCRCGSRLAITVLARHPDGQIAEATYACESGHDHGHGWYCDMGTIDLGLVTDEQLASGNDFEVFT